MEILYKYYSKKLDLKKYLEDPTLRLAQLTTLNDPFEGKIDKKSLGILAEKLCEVALPEECPDSNAIIFAKKSIERIINTYGIISLSETHRNLLMWAHYASEHQGFCIGYRTDALPQEDIEVSEGEFIKPYPLLKVNYDNIVFDHDYIEIFNEFQFSEDEPFKKVSVRALTTKSEDWSYEKEYRIVSHVEFSDIIRVYKSKEQLSENQSKIVSAAANRSTYDVEYSESLIQLTSKLTDIEKTEYIYNIYSIENALINYKDIFFLKRIDKSKVSSIYFGVYSEVRYIEEIINDVIMRDPQLKHIKVYKYTLSDERYELKPILLYPPKTSSTNQKSMER